MLRSIFLLLIGVEISIDEFHMKIIIALRNNKWEVSLPALP